MYTCKIIHLGKYVSALFVELGLVYKTGMFIQFGTCSDKAHM